MPADDPTDPGATIEQLIARYGLEEVVGRRPAERDNRGAELARALFTPTPRPTTQLDLLFGGYLIFALTILTGGLFGIAGSATIGGASTTGAPLGWILGGIQDFYAAAGPKTALEALTVVQQAVARANATMAAYGLRRMFEVGVASILPGGAIQLLNKGGILTILGADGSILVRRGTEVLLRVP
jgi:hypothetical protein